ncbi:MAG: recombinase family protein [Pseudonocardiaceae bacterium]
MYRARQAVALAERESNKLSKRKEESRAKDGHSHASGRTYGFKKGNIDLDLEGKEYEGLRAAGERRMKGWSFKEIAYWMNENNHRTTEGRLFYPLTVRNMLRRVRYAPWPDDPERAIREHKGEHYKAQWKPVWTPDEWESLQLMDKLGYEKYKDRPKAKKYLLTGFLVCGCDGSAGP